MGEKKEFEIKILEAGYITHDTRYFILEKPKDYSYLPGQATELSIKTPELKNKKRPFTFTTHPDNPYLEFIIKMYPEHEEGVTKHLKDIKEGDKFLLGESWGAINYKGKGVFIAGGAGITPFIAILRYLRKNNQLHGHKLLFSNKTSKDIILENELKSMLEENCIFTLTREKNSEYLNERISEKFLKSYITDFSQHFYVCGPIRFVGEITSILQKLGANPDSIVVET